MSKNSAFVDKFATENLPAQELWPELFGNEHFPAKLNCATELLDKQIAQFGSKPVFYYKDEIWSYRELLERANQIANFLVSDCGLVPGNRVLLRGSNTPFFAACWYAVLKAGGICVTTMPLLRARELGYIIEKAKIKHAICEAAWADEVNEAKKVAPQLSKIAYFGSDSADTLEQLLKTKSTKFNNVETASDDTALIAFTSGTTGKAKATMHFHRDVISICEAFPRHVLKPDSEDIFIGTPPFAFTFGLGGLVLFPMHVGAAAVLLDKSAPEEVLRAIEHYKASVCFTSPTGYRVMLEHLSKYNISSLQRCVSAGETLPISTFVDWHRATGIKIIDGIGSTELLHIFISAADEYTRPGATGKPVPGYEACIIDENGVKQPPNTIGLLAVKGPTGCRYMSDEKRQKEYVRDGWNVTGDAYLMDDDGYFWFQARADDMIISSGYNISANEVENVLLAHPIVKECGVIGKPDETRGQIVKAFVVLREQKEARPETAKALQDFVKAEIAPYKYPREVEFVSVLPRTETGKLQRFRLKEGT